MLIHNYLFTTTAYTLLEFYLKDAKLFAVVKQPFIKETQATNLDFVQQLLLFNGFKHKKNNDYFYPEIGIILEDLHDENVLNAKRNPLFY